MRLVRKSTRSGKKRVSVHSHWLTQTPRGKGAQRRQRNRDNLFKGNRRSPAFAKNLGKRFPFRAMTLILLQPRTRRLLPSPAAQFQFTKIIDNSNRSTTEQLHPFLWICVIAVCHVSDSSLRS